MQYLEIVGCNTFVLIHCDGLRFKKRVFIFVTFRSHVTSKRKIRCRQNSNEKKYYCIFFCFKYIFFVFCICVLLIYSYNIFNFNRLQPLSTDDQSFLEAEVERLLEQGFHWDDPYTQCVLQTLIGSFHYYG